MNRQSALWIVGLALVGAASCRDPVERRVARILEWERRPTVEHVEAIRRSLADHEAPVRAGALAALVRLGVADARERSRAALGDPDASVRAAAVKCLLDLRDTDALPDLERVAASDTDWRARRGALAAIGALGSAASAASAEIVVRALADPSSQVRLAAVEAATVLGPAVAIPALSMIVAEETSWEVRAAAAVALGRTESGEAYAPLETALRDANEFVRGAAAASIRELKRLGVAVPVAAPPAEGDATSGAAGVYSPPRIDP